MLSLPGYDSAALDSSNPKPGPASTPPKGGYVFYFTCFISSCVLRQLYTNRKTSAKHQAPEPVQPTNVSFQPYPPEISTQSLGGFFGHMDKLGYMLAAGLTVVWLFTAFGRG